MVVLISVYRLNSFLVGVCVVSFQIVTDCSISLLGKLRVSQNTSVLSLISAICDVYDKSSFFQAHKFFWISPRLSRNLKFLFNYGRAIISKPQKFHYINMRFHFRLVFKSSQTEAVLSKLKVSKFPALVAVSKDHGLLGKDAPSSYCASLIKYLQQC